MEIEDPVARNDSIVGRMWQPTCTVEEAMDPSRECPEELVPVAVPGSDVVELELRRPSVIRSVGLATGLLLITVQVLRVSIRVFGA